MVGRLTVSIRVSMHGRPTVSSLLLIGERGTLQADLFHGFVVRQPGEVSRRRKIVQPFGLAGALFGTAGVNLAGRAWRRELAYPGLRELMRRAYAAAGGACPPPIEPADVLDVATSVERITLSIADH
jgi:predicted dehydrogenase